MNKLSISFLLVLIASMAFAPTLNTVHADSQLDILIKITENIKEHIKAEIDKMNVVPQQVYQLYDDGIKETDLLIQATQKEDAVSAKQHFINSMVAFKNASIAIAESDSEKTQKILIPDRSQTIKKYENNINKLKIISNKLNANINFEQIDNLLTLAKSNLIQGNFEQNEEIISNIVLQGKKIYQVLFEISEKNKIFRAKHFAQKYAERINVLISQAKEIGLYQTADDLEQSKIQLLQANTTKNIIKQFKITITFKLKVDQVKEIHHTKLLKYKSTIDSLENKAKRLADDATENSGADFFLNKVFSLIEEVNKDLQDLEYAPATIRDDPKYFDLTIGKKIKTIKDILIKVEKLIYTSS